MVYYLINIILLIIGNFVSVSMVGKKKARLFVCVQATIQWILLSGLRDVSVGADTRTYLNIFEEVKNSDWQQILALIPKMFNGGEDVKDPGYYLLIKIFQLFTNDYQIFLLFVAIVFFIPMGVWIYRYSNDVLLSYILFSCLFYSFFAITGTRQTIVMGIGFFIGSELIKKKKYFLYYLLIILLIPIHRSVFILFFYPLINKISMSNIATFIWVVLIIVAWLFRYRLLSVTTYLFGYSSYDKEIAGAGVGTFTILFMMILIIMIIFKNRIADNHEQKNGLNALLTAALLLPLVSINPSAMRAVQYFSIYLLTCVPWLIGTTSQSERPVLTILAESALVMLMIINNPYYIFFWM